MAKWHYFALFWVRTLLIQPLLIKQDPLCRVSTRVSAQHSNLRHAVTCVLSRWMHGQLRCLLSKLREDCINRPTAVSLGTQRSHRPLLALSRTATDISQLQKAAQPSCLCGGSPYRVSEFCGASLTKRVLWPLSVIFLIKEYLNSDPYWLIWIFRIGVTWCLTKINAQSLWIIVSVKVATISPYLSH